MRLTTTIRTAAAMLLLLTGMNLQAQVSGMTSVSGDVYNITSFGAIADGKTFCTNAIQNAIDKCSGSGGGTVLIPFGTFLTGSISLKSNVLLYLSKNSMLIASSNISDYSDKQDLQSFILIDKAENVSISGEGVINGRGNLFTVAESAPNRPFLVLVRESKDVNIENVTLKNSAKWTLRLLNSQHIIIKGISIYSHTNFNNDGIDIDSKDVIISDCIIDSDDDAICLKSDSKRICENVVVSNCILASNCNFIKFGTSCVGGFKNISISTCALRHASESNHRRWNKLIAGVTDSISGISGIALEVVDGGFIDQVTINNITMDGIQTPVFMRLGSRKNPTGSLKNVIISNIVATTHSKIPCLISGVPGFCVENVVLRDMIINCMGGGDIADLKRNVPENEKSYPENRMFGNSLPAYGMYIRHAKSINIENIRFVLLQPDFRPAIFFDDAQDIDIRNLKASPPSGNAELIMKRPSDKIRIEK